MITSTSAKYIPTAKDTTFVPVAKKGLNAMYSQICLPSELLKLPSTITLFITNLQQKSLSVLKNLPLSVTKLSNLIAKKDDSWKSPTNIPRKFSIVAQAISYEFITRYNHKHSLQLAQADHWGKGNPSSNNNLIHVHTYRDLSANMSEVAKARS